MTVFRSGCYSISVCIALTTHAQQSPAPAHSGTRSTTFNVTVTPSGSTAASTLTAQDFKLLDNKTDKPIVSVNRVTPPTVPVSAIIVIDAVNVPYIRLAYAREQVEKFLKSNGGHLAQPTTIAVLTDKGAQITNGFSTDGNALSSSLSTFDIGLREIRRNSGVWGADERVQISLTALHQLLAYGANIKGRKIVLWVSPGWPLLSGPRIDLDAKQQNGIFADVVSYSRQLQQGNITMYDINPLGPEENLNRADYYQSFLKGITKPNGTDVADLSLQVLAAQSCGLVITGNSDVAGNLAKCEDDTRGWYELTFDMAAAEHPNEYHHIQVEVDKPGVTARTRDGYYAQP